MLLYVVTREGVYTQGIVGVFATKEAAREAAKEAKAREGDKYHSFAVAEYELGEVYNLYIYWERNNENDTLNEPEQEILINRGT